MLQCVSRGTSQLLLPLAAHAVVPSCAETQPFGCPLLQRNRSSCLASKAPRKSFSAHQFTPVLTPEQNSYRSHIGCHSRVVAPEAETPEARATDGSSECRLSLVRLGDGRVTMSEAGARFRRFLRTSAELCSTIWKVCELSEGEACAVVSYCVMTPSLRPRRGWSPGCGELRCAATMVIMGYAVIGSASAARRAKQC